jgi:AAA domain
MDAVNISTKLKPDPVAISRHLYELFSVDFVRHPDAWIEVAFALPDKKLDSAKNFSAFELKQAAEFAEAKNGAGYNIYVGAALRLGKQPRSGRANTADHFHAAKFSWIEYDGAGDHERIVKICENEGLKPAMLVTTGTTPNLRCHLYFLNARPINDADELKAINTALRDKFGSDDVQNADRVLRLAGTVSYPSSKKAAKGYITELTTLRVQRDAPAYSVSALSALQAAAPMMREINANDDDDTNVFLRYGNSIAPFRLSDEQMDHLLNRHPNGTGDHWHDDLLAVAWELILRGNDLFTIRRAIAFACEDGVRDKDIDPLILKKHAEFHQAQREAGRDISAHAKPPQRFLTLDQWRHRDLPPRDVLLGQVFSTTSRTLLFAKTGLGKTNFAFAIAMRVSAGMPFLHWQGHRKCKVLYIDGEMSRALLKERLAAEEDRMLMEVSEPMRDQFRPVGFHALNTEDIEEFAPLNTRQGQAAIDKIIAEIGGIDFIILDNIMSLIPGSMREEEPWQKTMGWIRGLTKRRIGQLWVHHANDDDKVYGDKTRMWEMDSVISLIEVKRDNTDISFNLSFDKARERRPENRNDFAKTYVYLIFDEWRSDKAVAKPSKPPSPMAVKYFEALTNVVASGGGARTKRLHGLVAVHNDDWKSECELLGLLDPQGKANSQRAKFSSHRAELVAANKVACEGDFTWIRQPHTQKL